nr:MAG TPA: Cro/C1-type HTH DNA-binding domain protein [Caudoviricetes sp.]
MLSRRIGGEVTVKVSFKKLFKLLIDREMKKSELAAAANLSANTIAKLAKNENVSLDVLIRICTALNVDFGDIMELVPDSE